MAVAWYKETERGTVYVEVTMTTSEIARNDNGIDRSNDIRDSDGYTENDGDSNIDNESGNDLDIDIETTVTVSAGQAVLSRI